VSFSHCCELPSGSCFSPLSFIANRHQLDGRRKMSAHQTALGQQVLVAWLRNAFAGFLTILVLLSLLILHGLEVRRCRC
jgi:hypothetical protein